MLLFCKSIPSVSESYYYMKRNFNLQTVVLIGSGNVAGHLAKAMSEAGLAVVQVFSPHIDHARELAKKVDAKAINSYAAMNTQADFYLLMVRDGKIASVVEQLPQVDGVVCHTSGITPMETLDRFENYGVFYPFQTFSKNRDVDISQVPFCLEASSREIYEVLRTLAGKLSSAVYDVDTEQRRKLHLAAVLVNNFTNHLYAEAEDFLKENGLGMEMLLPLIRETVAKIEKLPATEAQTGPARRGDKSTIAKHLEMLKDSGDLKEIYQIFSQQILKKYHE